MRKPRIIVPLMVMVSFLVIVALVHAAEITRPPFLDEDNPTLGWFGCVNVTDNDEYDATLGETYLQLAVYNVTLNASSPFSAEFVLRNTAPAGTEMVITDILFDDGALDKLTAVDNTPFTSTQTVSFTQPSNKTKLPGDPSFEVTDEFSAQPAEPPPLYGVGPSEAVGIVFVLSDTLDFGDVAFALDEGFLRIGIRVQAFASGGSESFICSGEPTAITLASFSARAGSDSVVLAWETGTEIDNAGFNLYRAASASGPWTQLNGALIAAAGDAVSGASYSFVDSPGYGTFYYELEDVDFNGVSTTHGPLKATLAPPLRRPLRRPTLPQY